MYLKESNHSVGLERSIIDKLADFKYDYPHNPHNLRYFVNNMMGISRILFHTNFKTTESLLPWINHLEEKEML